MSLDDARQKCEAWRRDYNEERPHSAIGNRVPIELANRSAAPRPTLIEKALEKNQRGGPTIGSSSFEDEQSLQAVRKKGPLKMRGQFSNSSRVFQMGGFE
jgi:Integrase core domain